MENLRFKGLLWNFERRNKPGECWLYPYATHANGYAFIHCGNGKKTCAHRLSYIFYKGAIPDEYVIDHLCKNKLCVNPHHLEAVTQRVNILRGDSLGALRARMTHCQKGHSLSGKNLRIAKNGSRRCRTCDSARTKRDREKYPEKHKEYGRRKYLKRTAGIPLTGPPKGENHPLAKLTEPQVIEILTSDLGPTALSKKFGIKKITVYAIRSRRLWKHVVIPSY
jgi:hypothetical protein